MIKGTKVIAKKSVKSPRGLVLVPHGCFGTVKGKYGQITLILWESLRREIGHSQESMKEEVQELDVNGQVLLTPEAT